MLSQPTNIIPSNLSGIGDGVIDVNDGLTVSWQVNGYSPLTAYQVVIYQNDDASTEKYDTGKVTLDAPFYGMDREGNAQTFFADEITAEDLDTAGIVNGYANGYKLIITQWWGSGESDYIQQSSASVFVTRDTPSIAIDEITSPVESRDITIKATYTQAQGDSLSWVQWEFADNNDLDNLLYDSGKIETSLLEFYYDGLFSGTTYAIRITAQTENGVETTSGWVTFDVSYRVASSDGLVQVCRPAGAPYVQLSWTNRTAIVGRPSGEYTVIGGQCRIPEGENIVWDNNEGDPISFKDPWSIAWRGQVTDVSSPVQVMEMGTADDPFVLTVSSTGVAFDHGEENIFTEPFTVLPNNTFAVVITPDGYSIKQITFTGGLLPEDDLYPADNLYPEPVTRIINNASGDIDYEQEPITSITLNGPQVCEYVWMYNGSFSDNDIEYMTGSEWYEPIFDADTYFLVTFLDWLRADITGGNGDSLWGASIYRQEKGNSILQFVCDLPSGYLIARDYGIKSRTSYRYYVFQRGRSTYTSAPYVSDYVTPQFGSYAIYECEELEPKVFHVVQAFQISGNLSTGAVSNNNKPSVVQNFTRYPVWQSTEQNYKSGSITSLIGDFDKNTNEYRDTWSLAERFSALSTSTKPKFIRDTKGAIWKVQTNGAVTMTMDNKPYALPLKMQLPWVEVGDSSRDSIVVLPTDSMWEKDAITATTLYVNIETGSLIWEHEEDYSGSELTINTAGELRQAGTGFIEPAEMYVDGNGNLIAITG